MKQDIPSTGDPSFFFTSREISGIHFQDLEYEPGLDAKNIPHRIRPRMGLGRRDTQYPLVNTQGGEVVIRQQNEIIHDGIFKMLESISPVAFEIASLDILQAKFSGHGTLTPRSSDGGIDGVIYCRTPFQQIYLLQCKQYSLPVGVTEVKEFIIDSEIWGEEHGEEIEGIFIALNGYTQGARTEGENNDLILLTGQDLAEMALKNNLGIEQVIFPLLDGEYWRELSNVK